MRNQNPPVSSKFPPLITPASGWPIVPFNSNTPSLLVDLPPPPSIVYHEISKSFAPPATVSVENAATSKTNIDSRNFIDAITRPLLPWDQIDARAHSRT